MQWFKNKKIWAGVVALLVAGAAASQVHQLWQINKVKIMSEELFKPTQPNPFCFGRLMIDLPKHAMVTGSDYGHPDVDKFETTEGVTKEIFDKTVRDFETQLRTTKHEVDPSLLKAVVPVPGVPDAKIFVHWKGDYSEHQIMLTGYRWLPNNTQYKFVSEVDPGAQQLATEDMVSVVKGLRARLVNEVPTEHGYCIEGGFFPDTQTGTSPERSDLAIEFGSWADASISITSATVQVKEADTLLDRLRNLPARMPDLARIATTIRSGSRDVGPHKGEEVLAELNQDGRRIYSFIWEAEGELARNDLPHIHVEMRFDHENDGKPMLTKDQMLALWEYVLGHLRVRPTTATHTSQAEPQRTPLGEFAATGVRCPQTGYWHCPENDLQGNIRLFQHGETMPPAIVKREVSLIERIKGNPGLHRADTVWKLVRYEEPTVAASSAAVTETTQNDSPSTQINQVAPDIALGADSTPKEF